MDSKKLEDLKDQIHKADIHPEQIHLDNFEDYVKLIVGEEIDQDLIEQLEVVLNKASDNNFDIEQLQSEILLLLQRYIDSRSKGDKKRKLDKEGLKKELSKISAHILGAHSPSQNISKGSEHHYNISAQARANFLRTVKNFAVYEVYKVMNPKRIAGESKKDNFVHNVISRGIEAAKQYEGGRKHEIGKYSPQLINQLNRQQQKAKGRGM